MCSDRPKSWSRWLSLAEWWYNTNFHSSIQMTPFEALFGYKPPQLGIPQEPHGPDKLLNQFLDDRQQLTQLLRSRLVTIQE
jgi:hypothetical protein